MAKDLNPSHKKHISRLNRVSGQIEGVKGMIEDGRYCTDILNQLKAVRSAVKSLEASILTVHLNSCVKNAFESGSTKDREKKIEELQQIFYRHI